MNTYLHKIIEFKNITISNYINYSFVLYAFLLPISRGAISILSALLFVLWLFSGNFNKKIEFIKSNNVILYFFAFVGFSLLSLFWSDDAANGLAYIRKYWYFLVILVIATTVQKKFIEYAISAFLAGMLISEGLSYSIFFELIQWKHGSPIDPTPFMNHLQYSMFLTFTSLLLLNRFFYEEQLKWKILYFLYFLLVTSNLFLNGGRTGHLAFAVSIFVVGFLNIKNKLLAFFSMLALVVSIFYTAYHVSPVFKTRFDASVTEAEKITNEGTFCGSFGSRLGLWIVGSEIFLDNPIIGSGVIKSMDEMRNRVKESHPDKNCISHLPSYHNIYVQSAVHLGVIGLFLYLMIFYSILKLKIEDRYYFNLMIIFVSVYSVSSLVETMFHEQFSAALLALFTGIFIAQNRIENEA
ncbi:O-antigen ligase family protein [Sulfurimonas sp.]|uniref:O-antigen ligase family protein n=1 Tax=Sulfurimonas sp. TaxID=2022749 RepID=UPI001A03E66D|nr:O-antigen ligase family protein [Sulfurimonas sp.]MBE0514835.1 O-antigen ligase family protein [Sulfurimonas sp.]